MSQLKIDSVPGFDGIEFDFDSVPVLDPTKQFPDNAFTDGEISVAGIKASADKKFILGNDAKSIEFDGSVNAFGALGVYRKSEKIVDALKDEGLNESMANLSHLRIADDENLLALRWGYGFDASVKGKVSLAPTVPGLSLSFGASGKTTGLSVLLHSQKRTATVLNSITDTLQSWRVPRQIKSLNDLKPGTTVLYQTMGKLDLSLGVEYGYDFSWARDAIKIGSLSGDLKLKIEMGVKAQLGFSATGLYALALSRQASEEKIRLQVFRLKENGWSFAFDGAISAQLESVPIPDNIDDFIKGVFNLNGSQIFKDLEKFLDPDAKLEDLISADLVDYAKDLIHQVTGIDPIAQAEEAIAKFKKLITRWHELPHEITSIIYGSLSKDIDLGELKDFVSKVIDVADDPKKIADEITKHLQSITFFSTPVGKWLTAYSKQGILSLLANIETEREGLVTLAKKTEALLDGSTVEGMLSELQKWIDEKLHLDTVLNNTPDDLDKWLKKRLADFLGKQTVLMDDLNKIRDAINKLRNSLNDFYKKGYGALMEKYKAEFHFSFQKTTHNDALIDITLDFSGANGPAAAACLGEAHDGNFSRLLTEKISCLTINKAVFTHEIKRNTHLEVGLPYFKAFADHITESQASGEVVDKDGDRLWVFTMQAFDVLKKKKSLSKLSIEADLTESVEIRKFTTADYQTSYKFQYGKTNTRRAYLKTRYQMAVDEYLRTAVPSYSLYLDELDRYLDSQPTLVGANKFGNVLTSLEIGGPSKVVSAWKNLPTDLDDVFYQKMSFAVQRRLRQWVPVAYLQDEDKYDDTGSVYPLLVYMALPPFAKLIDEGVFYWDYDNDLVKAQEFELNCRSKLLTEVLPRVRESTASGAYDNSKIDAMKSSIFSQNGSTRFESLCGLEQNVIKSVVKTAKAFIEFLNAPDIDSKQKALAKFGSEFTDTFNDDLGHIDYTPKGALRPLGLILVKDIAGLLDPNLGDVGFSAMLELSVLKPSVNFDKAREDYFKGNTPKPEDTIIQQRMLSV